MQRCQISLNEFLFKFSSIILKYRADDLTKYGFYFRINSLLKTNVLIWWHVMGYGLGLHSKISQYLVLKYPSNHIPC